jgi:hypothetical protein
MAPLVQTVFSQGRTRDTSRLNTHFHNCPVHFSKVTEQFFIENQLLYIPHPHYSLDLAQPDFWLLGSFKTGLAGRGLADIKKLLEGSGNPMTA